MKYAFPALIFGLSAIAAPALAQQQCETPGVATANDLVLGEAAGDEERGASALAVMLSLAVQAEELTISDVGAPCLRGQAFQVGPDSYQLHGENTDAAPRLAIGARADAPLIAIQPLPPLVIQIMRELTGDSTGLAGAHMMTLQNAEQTFIVRLYETLPADNQLRADIATLASGYMPLVGFNRQSGAVTIFAGGDDEAGGAPARQPPRDFVEPDGEIFLSGNNRSAVHASSGFVCPLEVRGHMRRQMVDFYPGEGGMDVGCSYGFEVDANYSLYFTYLPDYPAEDHVRDASASLANMAGYAEDTAAPFALGQEGGPQAGAFWIDADGVLQSVLVSRIQGWHVKLRSSYRPEDVETATAIVSDIFGLAYERAAPR